MKGEGYPTVVLLDPEDLERSLRDPKLTALLNEGWRASGWLLVKDREETKPAVVLMPPTADDLGILVAKTARKVNVALVLVGIVAAMSVAHFVLVLVGG